MKRETWTFTFAASAVAQAASKLAQHHRERLSWWEGELAEAELDLREKGLQMREQPVSGGMRLQPVFDPGYQARVEECSRKVRDHREKAEEYEAYTRALTLAGERGVNVDLDVQDVKFFGL